MIVEPTPNELQSPNCIPNGDDILDSHCSPVSSVPARPFSPAVVSVKPEIQHEDVSDDNDDVNDAAVKSALLSPVVNGFRTTVEDITDDEDLDVKRTEQIEIKTEIKTEVEEPVGIENDNTSVKEEVKEETDAGVLSKESVVAVKEEVKTEDESSVVIKSEINDEESSENITDKNTSSVSEEPGKKGMLFHIHI